MQSASEQQKEISLINQASPSLSLDTPSFTTPEDEANDLKVNEEEVLTCRTTIQE